MKKDNLTKKNSQTARNRKLSKTRLSKTRKHTESDKNQDSMFLQNQIKIITNSPLQSTILLIRLLWTMLIEVQIRNGQESRNPNTKGPLGWWKSSITSTSRGSLYLIITTFTSLLRRSIGPSTNLFMTKSNTTIRSTKSTSTARIRLACVFSFHLSTTPKQNFISEI